MPESRFPQGDRSDGRAGPIGVALLGSTGSIGRQAVDVLEGLSDRFRVVALDPRGSDPWDAPGLEGPLVIVAGSESRGPSRAVFATSDRRVAIPLRGGVESLNVSVAVGVLLFEAVRQRVPKDGR